MINGCWAYWGGAWVVLKPGGNAWSARVDAYPDVVGFKLTGKLRGITATDLGANRHANAA